MGEHLPSIGLGKKKSASKRPFFPKPHRLWLQSTIFFDWRWCVNAIKCKTVHILNLEEKNKNQKQRNNFFYEIILAPAFSIQKILLCKLVAPSFCFLIFWNSKRPRFFHRFTTLECSVIQDLSIKVKGDVIQRRKKRGKNSILYSFLFTDTTTLHHSICKSS